MLGIGHTQKLSASKAWKYQLFYWDYGLGILLSSLLIAFTLGSIGSQGRSFLLTFARLDESSRVGFLGGVLFNLSNIPLVIAIDLAGLPWHSR